MNGYIIFLERNMEKENKNIEVYLTINPEVCIKLHSLEDGHEEELDINNFCVAVEGNDGKTCVHYYTDWEDCPTDCFYVQESVKEVEKLVEEAKDMRITAYEKYTVVPCDYKKNTWDKEKVIGWIKENAQKYTYSDGWGDAYIDEERLVDDLTKAMDE